MLSTPINVVPKVERAPNCSVCTPGSANVKSSRNHGVCWESMGMVLVFTAYMTVVTCPSSVVDVANASLNCQEGSKSASCCDIDTISHTLSTEPAEGTVTFPVIVV